MRGAVTTIAVIGIWVSSGSFALEANTNPNTKNIISQQLKDYGPFVVDEKLRPRILFWIDIYSKYNSWETVIHDVKYPQIVYSVVNTKNASKREISAAKYRAVAFLKKLARKQKDLSTGKTKRSSLSTEEEKMLSAFEVVGEGENILEAASLKRMRGQAGLKDNLVHAFFMSGRYLPRMERVFERFGLPTEIAYLPFVESGFNKRAVSKVGASGIWQFMPYTGKLFLRVDDVVDERNDPMRAAEAAARLMRQNYQLLQEWPLAVTAYNHGALGMARAAKAVGTSSLAEIIAGYESKTFGFASQNFYCSFLAALQVGKNSDFYLGDLPRAKKLEFDEFVMPHFMELSAFLRYMSVEESEFRELNPALTEEVFSGKKYIPVGYTIRVPIEIRQDFFAKYESIPALYKHGVQKIEEKKPSQSEGDAMAQVTTTTKSESN